MTFEFVVRMIGMVLLAIAGLRVGAVLAELAGVPGDMRVPYALVFTLVGALAGLILTPFLTTRPFRILRVRIRQVPAAQLVASLFGLIVGLIIAVLLAFPLSFLPSPFREVLPILAAIGCASLGVYTMSARQQDIANLLSGRLAAREVREAGSASPERFVLLDTSVIIDGRIADISQTGFISDTILVPRFVLNELQHIADSSDVLRRNRGRRGLDILNRLQKDSRAPIRITDMDVEDVREVDDKLVILAKRLKCPVLTNDFNLNRVAELQGVRVLNINELANAVKTVFLPGENMQVQIIQEGKEIGQGVAYLDDGTMVVVEEGRRYMNNRIQVTVTKVLQTAAGRMIFARPDNN